MERSASRQWALLNQHLRIRFASSRKLNFRFARFCSLSCHVGSSTSSGSVQVSCTSRVECRADNVLQETGKWLRDCIAFSDSGSAAT